MRSFILASLLLVAVVPSAHLSSAEGDAAANPPGGGWGGNREERMQRMIAENPELKGVDPATPEGQEKIRQVMQKRWGPQMQKRMAEAQAANHAKIKESFGMNDEEFAVVQPLIQRVESLKMQQRVIEMGSNPMGGGPGGGWGRGGGGFNPQMLLGDAQLDPAVQEIQDATKSLGALLDDQQANANEVGQALNRLRTARTAFQASFAKAQEELRSVLTPRQEAVLVQRGILE